ncbi:MAG: hypothetical protein ABFR82_06315 [Nitrospirota bacterium]
MNPNIKKLDPAVDKKFLIALSGIIWTLVGIMLCNLAVTWLTQTPIRIALLSGLSGLALALLIHHFGFLKLVDKNIARIMEKEGKVCIFGFQPWKSYMIILIMITMGIMLRSSTLPKQYLAIIYIGFGGAMLLSSLRYHRKFFDLLKKL